MNRFICARCLSEHSMTTSEDCAGRGTFPFLSAVGGAAGILGGLATMNPLVVPIGLISGLAGDAVCSACGSPEGLHAALDETEDEFGREVFLMESIPPAPWDDKHGLAEETDRQAYGFDEARHTFVPVQGLEPISSDATQAAEPDTVSSQGPTASPSPAHHTATVSAATQTGVSAADGAGSGGGAVSGGGSASGGGAAGGAHGGQ